MTTSQPEAKPVVADTASSAPSGTPLPEGPAGLGGATAHLPLWLRALGGVVAVMIVATVLLAGSRSTNHPIATEPTRLALANAVTSVVREAPALDIEAVRQAVGRDLAGWGPRNIQLGAVNDGREVLVTVLVRTDGSRGFLDRNGPHYDCLVVNARLGGAADARGTRGDECHRPIPAVWEPVALNVYGQRVRDTEVALRRVLEGYASRGPSTGQQALREALGTLVTPGTYPAAYTVGARGDVGVALRTEFECVLGWIGVEGGLQVWSEHAVSGCEPVFALERVPRVRS